MNGSKPKTRTETGASSYPEWDVEALLERIWNHLGGTVSRSTIRQVLAEVLPNYESARVQTFVPIFVHKETVKRLRAGLSELSLDDHQPGVSLPYIKYMCADRVTRLASLQQAQDAA